MNSIAFNISLLFFICYVLCDAVELNDNKLGNGIGHTNMVYDVDNKKKENNEFYSKPTVHHSFMYMKKKTNMRQQYKQYQMKQQLMSNNITMDTLDGIELTIDQSASVNAPRVNAYTKQEIVDMTTNLLIKSKAWSELQSGLGLGIESHTTHTSNMDAQTMFIEFTKALLHSNFVESIQTGQRESGMKILHDHRVSPPLPLQWIDQIFTKIISWLDQGAFDTLLQSQVVGWLLEKCVEQGCSGTSTGGGTLFGLQWIDDSRIGRSLKQLVTRGLGGVVHYGFMWTSLATKKYVIKAALISAIQPHLNGRYAYYSRWVSELKSLSTVELENFLASKWKKWFNTGRNIHSKTSPLKYRNNSADYQLVGNQDSSKKPHLGEESIRDEGARGYWISAPFHQLHAMIYAWSSGLAQDVGVGDHSDTDMFNKVNNIEVSRGEGGTVRSSTNSLSYVLKFLSVLNELEINVARNWEVDLDVWTEQLSVLEHTVVEEAVEYLFSGVSYTWVELKSVLLEWRVEYLYYLNGNKTAVDASANPLISLIELDLNCTTVQKYQQLYAPLVHVLRFLAHFQEELLTFAEASVPNSGRCSHHGDANSTAANESILGLYKYVNTLYTTLLTATTPEIEAHEGDPNPHPELPTYHQFYSQSLFTVWMHTYMPTGASLLKSAYILQNTVLRLKRMVHRVLIPYQKHFLTFDAFRKYYVESVCDARGGVEDQRIETGAEPNTVPISPSLSIHQTITSYLALSIDYLAVLLDCVDAKAKV